jgi:fluoroquinolone transport system permease protein
MRAYMGYRLLLPMAWSVVSIFIMVPLMAIAPVEPLVLLVIGLEAALLAPIFALAFVSFAANKVQGLAFSKGMGVLLTGPFVARFVPEPWQYLLGIFPSYWPMKAYWEHSADGIMWPWLAIGFVVAALYILPLLRRFNRMLYRTG